MFNSNQAFLVVQKLKSAPRALKQEKKLEIEKIFSICPKLLINAELYGPKAEKKDTITLGKPICNARHYLPIVICRMPSNSFPSKLLSKHLSSTAINFLFAKPSHILCNIPCAHRFDNMLKVAPSIFQDLGLEAKPQQGSTSCIIFSLERLQCT